MLYIEATALGSAAGDATPALSALDEVAKDFDVDLWKLKSVALAAAAEKSPTKENEQGQVELLLPMIAEAVEADNYETSRSPWARSPTSRPASRSRSPWSRS